MLRAVVGLYLAIGIVLLAIAFLLPGPCTSRNTDIVSHVVFVLTWPVGLYAGVYQGQMSAKEWLHAQACEGGGELVKGNKVLPSDVPVGLFGLPFEVDGRRQVTIE